MKNQDILDNFGRKLISQILDRYYMWTLKEIDEGITNPTRAHFNAIFKQLDTESKQELKNYILEGLNSIMFDMLCFFEENEEFKLIYESENKQVDLVKISENLKAELIIEGGWIDRFSEYRDKKDEPPN